MTETEPLSPSSEQSIQPTKTEEIDGSTTQDFDASVVDKNVLVPRQDGRISPWHLTGAVNSEGKYWAGANAGEIEEKDGKIGRPGKYVHPKTIGDDIQSVLAEKLAMDRPGLTAEQLERGERPIEGAVEDLGKKAVEAAVDASDINEPEPALEPEPGADIETEAEKPDEAVEAEITMLTAEYKHRIERTLDQLAEDARNGVRGIEGDVEEATGYLHMLVRMVDDASTALDKGWRQYDNGSYSKQTLAHLVDDASNTLHGSISRLAYADGFSSTVSTRLRNLAEAFNQGKDRLAASEHDFDALMIDMKVAETPAGTSTESVQTEVDNWLEAIDEMGQSLPKGELVPDAATNLRTVLNMLDELTNQLRRGYSNHDQVVTDMRGAVNRLKNVIDSARNVDKRPIIDADALDKLRRGIVS